MLLIPVRLIYVIGLFVRFYINNNRVCTPFFSVVKDFSVVFARIFAWAFFPSFRNSFQPLLIRLLFHLTTFSCFLLTGSFLCEFSFVQPRAFASRDLILCFFSSFFSACPLAWMF